MQRTERYDHYADVFTPCSSSSKCPIIHSVFSFHCFVFSSNNPTNELTSLTLELFYSPKGAFAATYVSCASLTVFINSTWDSVFTYWRVSPHGSLTTEVALIKITTKMTSFFVSYMSLIFMLSWLQSTTTRCVNVLADVYCVYCDSLVL